MHYSDISQEDITPDGISVGYNRSLHFFHHEFCETLMATLSEILSNAQIVLIFDLQ
jgi:hypothetical protein